jgi:carboxymethylenebutenolidase
VSDLNWMQRYAASEMLELGVEGRLDRRSVLRYLTMICGSTAAAGAFLAACGSEEESSSSSTGASTRSSTTGESSTTSAPPTSIVPPTAGEAGHVLSVATDDPDVRGSNVEFGGPASTMFGYLAEPSVRGSYPGVIVIHEIFGLNDHIRDVARRLAKVGFIALAPDLASRAGGSAIAENVPGVLTSGPVEDRIADLDATATWLSSVAGYSGALGVIGFCFGGGMTLSYAATNADIRAAIPYYGPTPEPAADLAATNAAILAHYGATDERVNAGIPALESAMSGKTLRVRVWGGAGHAFNNDSLPTYVEATAVDAWTETVNWLATYLG